MASAYAIADNRIPELATWDEAKLDAQLVSLSAEWSAAGLTYEAPGLDADFAERAAPADAPEEEEESGPAEEAEEPPLRVEAEADRVAPGDLWALGAHRLLCGDATTPGDVCRLLGEEKVSLVHADPPYGLGLEIENDNLHGERLDAFQVAWWEACWPYLAPNASCYIWGTPQDLWRVWPKLTGGTFRNEIVWSKGASPGQRSPDMRSYAISTERALFFVLGREELGNRNAEDFWEGFEPLRLALEQERNKAKWKNTDVARICGVTDRMARHWFTRSQWIMIPEEHYEALRAADEWGGFSMPYADVAAYHAGLMEQYNREVRGEFYDSRAFFDNTHDNMSEVWEFPRVRGEERFGHATPKPVALVSRALQSSSRPGDLVYEPFIGSGTAFVAGEQTGRRVYGLEIDPGHCATAIARWEAESGKAATRADSTKVSS